MLSFAAAFLMSLVVAAIATPIVLRVALNEQSEGQAERIEEMVEG